MTIYFCSINFFSVMLQNDKISFLMIMIKFHIHLQFNHSFSTTNRSNHHSFIYMLVANKIERKKYCDDSITHSFRFGWKFQQNIIYLKKKKNKVVKFVARYLLPFRAKFPSISDISPLPNTSHFILLLKFHVVFALCTFS